MEKNNSCHPVTVEWSSYKALYVWKFLNCRKSFLSPFKGVNGLLWKKGHNLSLVMQFENFEIYKDLYVHVKPLNHDWGAKVVFPTQILLIFGGCCSRYFWDIPLKIYRLPDFNMLLQFLLTIIPEVFSCLQKVKPWLFQLWLSHY